MQYDSIYDEFGKGWFDYNPVHAVWYLLVSSGIPEGRLNEQSFLAAAITIYDEGKGISGLLRHDFDIKTLIKQILAHIDGLLVWGNDGKLHLILIRDNYTVDDLPVINENVVLEEPTLDRPAWIDTYGEIKIQFNKRVYPPAELRYYQEAFEVLRRGRPYVWNYEEAIEVLRGGVPEVWNYQEVVEIIRANVQASLDDITIMWNSTTTTT